jgi:hypothetical protein
VGPECSSRSSKGKDRVLWAPRSSSGLISIGATGISSTRSQVGQGNSHSADSSASLTPQVRADAFAITAPHVGHSAWTNSRSVRAPPNANYLLR